MPDAAGLLQAQLHAPAPGHQPEAGRRSSRVRARSFWVYRASPHPSMHCRALYERDARRQFCPPALWLEPYHHLIGSTPSAAAQQAQQAQQVSGAAVVRALLATEDDGSSDGQPGRPASSPRGGAAGAAGAGGVGAAAASRPAAVAAILTAAPQCVPFEERVSVFRALIDADKER